MNRDEYVQKAQSVINTYEAVPKDPTKFVEDSTKSIMKSKLKGRIPDSDYQRLLPHHSRTAVFYGLPKTHKAGNPLHPIVSSCGAPLDKLSWFVQQILTQLLAFIPAHLTNTYEYLMRLTDKFPLKLPPGGIVFSLDVCNLYGSIPVQEGINAVVEQLETNVSKINTFGTSLTDIKALLNHILTNNYLRFGSHYYKQTAGVPMGNRIAPPVAIAFMHILETGFMSTFQYLPVLYVRYIDDIFGIWTHGIEKLMQFADAINSYNQSIRFTMEHSHSTGKLSFLDTLITVKPCGAYTTELFVKPMSAPIILNFASAHSMSTKRAMLNEQMNRAVRLSSDREACNRSLSQMKDLFILNGYPRHLVDRAARSAVSRPHRRRDDRGPSGQSEPPIYMRLPYIDESTKRRVEGIVRGSKWNIRLSWLSGPTLENKLVKSALEPPKCPSRNRCHTCRCGLEDRCLTRNVVYKISCKLCESAGRAQFYIGESKRPIRYRFNEHLGDARLRRLDTPLGEHVLEWHADIPSSNVNDSFRIEILSADRDVPEVKIDESIHIRNLTPTLNTMSSSWPLVNSVG